MDDIKTIFNKYKREIRREPTPTATPPAEISKPQDAKKEAA